MKAAKVASDIEEKPTEEVQVEGDEERRAGPSVASVKGPPLLRPLVDDIVNGKLQATRLKQRLEAAKSEAAALGNEDSSWDTVELAKKVESFGFGIMVLAATSTYYILEGGPGPPTKSSILIKARAARCRSRSNVTRRAPVGPDAVRAA